MERVVAITVTYNRTRTLERCLNALLKQTRFVDAIIIIDNNSCLEEKERLKQIVEGQENIHILWMEENLGGAGGFEAGMRECREKYDADWYWIMDDDAYPRENCLEVLLKARTELPESGYLAPLIYGVDLHEYQLYHHKYLRGLIYKNVPVAKKYAELESVSRVDANAFVGPLISKEAVRKVGIADGSLFIYGDDTEYTFRISRKMESYLIKGAIIDHQDPPLSENYLDPKAWWKEYYSYRNQYFMIREFQSYKILKPFAYVALTLPILKLMIAAAIKHKYRGLHSIRVRLLMKAISDGLCNRRGKTLDPAEYNRVLNVKSDRRKK